MGLLIGFTTILVVIAIGSALAHTGVLDDRSQRTLGEIAFFVATPALMVVTISRVEVSGAAANLAASAGSLAFCFVAYALIARLRWKVDTGALVIGSLVRVVRQRRQPRPGDRGVRRRRHHRRRADAAGADARRAAGVPDRARPGHRPRHRRARGARRLTTNPLTAAAVLGLVLAVTGWSLPEVVVVPARAAGERRDPADAAVVRRRAPAQPPDRPGRAQPGGADRLGAEARRDAGGRLAARGRAGPPRDGAARRGHHGRAPHRAEHLPARHPLPGGRGRRPGEHPRDDAVLAPDRARRSPCCSAEEDAFT